MLIFYQVKQSMPKFYKVKQSMPIFHQVKQSMPTFNQTKQHDKKIKMKINLTYFSDLSDIKRHNFIDT